MILQNRMPYDPFSPKPLPGIAPMDPGDWILVDDGFAGQMAERARLLRERRDEVLALDDSARPAAQELLEAVLQHLEERADYDVAGDTVRRPDGAVVPLDRGDPMGTLGHLVQQDLCILQKCGDEHALTGAVLCFPASWMLAEKFMRPLIRIHVPVESYDGDMARRVQRLFDGIRPGRPMWRFNALWYADPTLFQPRSESDRRAERHAARADYMRSERQSLWRLPETGAVVFGIHTFMVPRSAVEAQFPTAE